MLNLNSDTCVYVVCGANYKTGGTELLHQLVYTLNGKGVNAFITYTDVKNDVYPINEAFKIYVNDYKQLTEINDDKNNIVILPEINIKLLERIKNARVAVWWLSVDNYLKVSSMGVTLNLVGPKGVLWYFKNRSWRFSPKNISPKIDYNFAQSHYALDFLKQGRFKNVVYLSDYINDVYFEEGNCKEIIKEDIALYNPKKGYKFTKKLIQASPEIKWIPIENLSTEEVRELLLKCKVYVDFGNHPGKDRFPREAAISGCCIITSKKGSAYFYEDVMIDSAFKFEDKTKFIPSIIEKIKSCFDDYEKNNMLFNDYREMIKGEKTVFLQDVENIFTK